jgi:hypothetical protein
MNIFSRFSKKSADSYELKRLVDYRVVEKQELDDSKMHIICDIDKTYLETEFESIVKIA